MKKYRVIANGVEYEVEIELISDSEAAPKKEETKPESAPAAGVTKVSAPLAGTVTSVNVKAGDAVKKGQNLMILEAMKMENEILAPCDGQIASVNVKPSDQVEAGTPLCTVI